MKSFKELIIESQASEEAEKRELKHVSFGNYADKSGKIVAQSRNGKLIKVKSINKAKQKSKKYNSEKIENFISNNHNPSYYYSEVTIRLKKNELDKLSKFGLNVVPSDKFRIVSKNNNRYFDLGSGTRGTAYQLSNGDVLKVTNDKSEARTSLIIKNNPHPNIVNFKKIFQLKGKINRYYIEMEKLNLLSTNFSNFIDKMKDPEDSDDSDDLDNLEKVSKNNKYKKYAEQLVSALKHLKKLNIKFKDLHSGNVMLDDKNNIKIIDLGYTKGKGLKKSPPIKIIE